MRSISTHLLVGQHIKLSGELLNLGRLLADVLPPLHALSGSELRETPLGELVHCRNAGVRRLGKGREPPTGGHQRGNAVGRDGIIDRDTQGAVLLSEDVTHKLQPAESRDPDLI